MVFMLVFTLSVLTQRWLSVYPLLNAYKISFQLLYAWKIWIRFLKAESPGSTRRTKSGDRRAESHASRRRQPRPAALYPLRSDFISISITASPGAARRAEIWHWKQCHYETCVWSENENSVISPQVGTGWTWELHLRLWIIFLNVPNLKILFKQCLN